MAYLLRELRIKCAWCNACPACQALMLLAATEIELLTAERDEARDVARQFAPSYPRDVLAEKVRAEHLHAWPWLAGDVDTPT